jgi:hypothetical protein
VRYAFGKRNRSGRGGAHLNSVPYVFRFASKCGDETAHDRGFYELGFG